MSDKNVARQMDKLVATKRYVHRTIKRLDTLEKLDKKNSNQVKNISINLKQNYLTWIVDNI
uniref:ADOR15 n=1 Tax=Adoxophyes orana granulovirus TaxID=170617 RepID=A0A0A7V4T9_GVAO|nr:ADOR15 [Adoxophyes orana granulovirus]